MRIADVSDLVMPYLDTLGTGFHVETAPDGTGVLSSPFKFITGDPVEIAVWEESNEVFLSDRGGLLGALTLAGLDPLVSDTQRDTIMRAASVHGASLQAGTMVRSVTEEALGQGIQALVQALMDAQAAACGATGRSEVRVEPAAHATIRDVSNRCGVRYREDVRVDGALRRRYPVDFQLAFETDEIMRAVLVVATGRTLELAERWNFRFRDIHVARPRLHRLFLVDEDANWSGPAQATIEQECECVFPPGEAEALAEYVQTAQPLIA